MNRAKKDIVASITRAKLELDDALEDLKGLPSLDPLLLGFIAQAIHNYLHVSSGTLELLGEALKEHPDKQIGIWLKGLKDAAARMGNLVNEMKGKPRHPVPQMRFEKIDLGLLVGRACDFYRRPAARKGVEMVFEKPAPGLPLVRTDRVAVAAILDSLLSNAVKFSPAGKKISVGLRMEGGEIVCRVEDEGPGLSREARETLFQRSARRKSRAAAGEPLVGYGLVVAAELVTEIGGEIGCNSEPGKGACFFFRLPNGRMNRSRPQAK